MSRLKVAAPEERCRSSYQRRHQPSSAYGLY